MSVTFQSTPTNVCQLHEGVEFTALVVGRQATSKALAGTTLTLGFNTTNYNALKSETTLFVRCSLGDYGVYQVTAVNDGTQKIDLTVPSGFDSSGTAYAEDLSDLSFRITAGIFDSTVEGNKPDKIIGEIDVSISVRTGLVEFDIQKYLRSYILSRQVPAEGYDEAFNLIYRVQEIDSIGNVLTSDSYRQALFGAGSTSQLVNAYTPLGSTVINRVDKSSYQAPCFLSRLDVGRRLIENVIPLSEVEYEIADYYRIVLVAGAKSTHTFALDGLDTREVVAVTRPSVRVTSPSFLEASYTGLIEGYVGIDQVPVGCQVKVYRGASNVSNVTVDESTGKWSYTATANANPFSFILENISPPSYGAPWEEELSSTVSIPSFLDVSIDANSVRIDANLTGITAGGLYSVYVTNPDAVELRIDVDVLSVDSVVSEDCRDFKVIALNQEGGWSMYSFTGKRQYGVNLGAVETWKDSERVRRVSTIKDVYDYVDVSTKLLNQEEVDLLTALRISPLIYAYNSDSGQYDIPMVLDYGSFPTYMDKYKKSGSEVSFRMFYATERKIQTL